MAQTVMLQHPKTGILKQGFYGFSWTTLFFGGFPALFRGDFVIGCVFIVLQFFTWGLSGLVFAFFYNRQFTLKLLESGYEFCDTDEANKAARMNLGIANIKRRLAV